MNSKEKNIAATILSAVLVVALMICAAFNVLLIDRSNPANNAELATKNNVELNVQSPLNMTMTASEAVATTASAQTYSITVTPDVSLSNTQIDWSISFKNSSSTWATGKTVTDYATITPTTDGALTANLNVLQPFAEQIIVRASLREDSTVKAVCKVDYRTRYKRKNVIEGNEFVSNYDETSIGSLPSTDTLYFDIFPSDYYRNFLEELWYDEDFTQYISQNASAIDIEYCRDHILQFDSYDETYGIKRSKDLTKKSGHITLPLFSHIRLVNEDEQAYKNGYIGGFYAANSSDKEDCELMMCRFLGLYPNLNTTDNQWEWDFDYYKSRISKAGILGQISAFKTAFNAFVDKDLDGQGNMGFVSTSSDYGIANLNGYIGLTDAHGFEYAYMQPMYNIETYREYPLLWVFNKFTI